MASPEVNLNPTEASAQDSSVSPAWPSIDDCCVDDLKEVVEVGYASALRLEFGRIEESGIAVYNASDFDGFGVGAAARDLIVELNIVLSSGPGVVAVKGAFSPDVIAGANRAFEALLERQRQTTGQSGDHFAPAGTNERLWNVQEKFAVHSPDAYAEYYCNLVLASVATAWLGPGYQVTSQLNVVNPGSPAQRAHRDYHLGFMDGAEIGKYPPQVHQMSPLLTLQGAVAHCNMPTEAGPTMYLPHSQKYRFGYLASHLPEFTAYFDNNHVQPELHAGDAVFFNPAVFHGAGMNRTSDVRRIANLLQISSPFGKAMELVDHDRIVEAILPIAQKWKDRGRDKHQIDALLAASADGYPFPANLDVKTPGADLRPPSQLERLHEQLDG